MYSTQVLDHFEHPRNSGALEAPTAKARVENPGCGDVLELALRVNDGVIVDARFLAKGCAAAIACGSGLAEFLPGKSLAEARDFKREQLLATLGGLPSESVHASHLAMDALRAALSQIKK